MHSIPKNKRTPLALMGLLIGITYASFASIAWTEELPTDLKNELKDIRSQMERIESRMTRIDPEKTTQSIREVALWVDEFSLDAELLDDDPLLKELNGLVENLRGKAEVAAKEIMANQSMNAPEKKERLDISTLLKTPVNMSNVSFKRDVAPIIANTCMGCHNPQRSSGEFDASTFASFTEMITPGDPDGSHVLNLVTGKAEPRMPRGGQTTFTKEWADIWTAWIKQGAKFDGSNKTAPITSYMIDFDVQRREALSRMSTEDLEKIHLSESQRHMDIVSPKKDVHFYQSPNVLAYTTLNSGDAEYIAWLSEAVLEDLTIAFGMKNDPVFRGRLGVSVFADRFDYLAFAQEVDGYSPESTQFGHARLRPEYQYVAMTSDHADYVLDGVVAQHVAAAFVESLGNRRLPRWAIYGFSRQVGSEFEGRQKSVAYSNELKRAYELASGGRNLLVVFRENTAWVELAPLSASFFHFAMKTDEKKTVAFLKELSRSGNVQKAITDGFGSSPDQVSQAWIAWLRKR